MLVDEREHINERRHQDRQHPRKREVCRAAQGRGLLPLRCRASREMLGHSNGPRTLALVTGRRSTTPAATQTIATPVPALKHVFCASLLLQLGC